MKKNHAKYSKAWKDAHPERYMLSGSKHRAKLAGITFSIKEEDIIIPEFCPVLGIKLERGVKLQDASPSLDRFKPELGYVPGNVHVISLRANRIKSNATLEELRLVTRYVEFVKETALPA
jgi:hypothetical protein